MGCQYNECPSLDTGFPAEVSTRGVFGRACFFMCWMPGPDVRACVVRSGWFLMEDSDLRVEAELIYPEGDNRTCARGQPQTGCECLSGAPRYEPELACPRSRSLRVLTYRVWCPGASFIRATRGGTPLVGMRVASFSCLSIGAAGRGLRIRLTALGNSTDTSKSKLEIPPLQLDFLEIKHGKPPLQYRACLILQTVGRRAANSPRSVQY
eukprot:78017-Rhodomonas_salina.1